MKYTLHDLTKALNVMEYFNLLGASPSNIAGRMSKPDRFKKVVDELNGKTKRKRTKMTPELIDRVWGLHNQNVTQRDIAKEIGCHFTTVGRVLRNEVG